MIDKVAWYHVKNPYLRLFIIVVWNLLGMSLMWTWMHHPPGWVQTAVVAIALVLGFTGYGWATSRMVTS